MHLTAEIAEDARGNSLCFLRDLRISSYNSLMAKTQPSPFPFPPKRVRIAARQHPDAGVIPPRYARAIAKEFRPDKIILFGSYAYGTPHEDSDVDLLVVMPARNQHSQAVRILWRLAAPFPVDLVVRSPYQMIWRLKERESFTTEIVGKGKMLYEKVDSGVGQKGRARLPSRKAKQPQQDTSP